MGIGGDWYDVVDLSPTETGVVIGDVTGHGTAAVVVMAELQALTRHLLCRRHAARGDLQPARPIAATPRHLRHGGGGPARPAAGTFTYVNAGHPAPILRRGATSGAAAHIVELAGGRRPLLGVGTPLEPAETEAVAVAAGDLLLLYTDGLIERREESMADSGVGPAGPHRRRRPQHRRRARRRALAGGPGRPDAADDDAAALARADRDGRRRWERRLRERPLTGTAAQRPARAASSSSLVIDERPSMPAFLGPLVELILGRTAARPVGGPGLHLLLELLDRALRAHRPPSGAAREQLTLLLARGGRCRR
ncbi:MAG: SpoIIE family protein phosphatase [Acidimicrobiales bacterium]